MMNLLMWTWRSSSIKLCTVSPLHPLTAKATHNIMTDNENVIGVCHLLRKLTETIKSHYVNDSFREIIYRIIKNSRLFHHRVLRELT